MTLTQALFVINWRVNWKSISLSVCLWGTCLPDCLSSLFLLLVTASFPLVVSPREKVEERENMRQVLLLISWKERKRKGGKETYSPSIAGQSAFLHSLTLQVVWSGGERNLTSMQIGQSCWVGIKWVYSPCPPVVAPASSKKYFFSFIQFIFAPCSTHSFIHSSIHSFLIHPLSPWGVLLAPSVCFFFPLFPLDSSIRHSLARNSLHSLYSRTPLGWIRKCIKCLCKWLCLSFLQMQMPLLTHRLVGQLMKSSHARSKKKERILFIFKSD